MSRKMGDTNTPERDATTLESEEARTRPGRRSVEDRQAAVLDLMAGKATVDQLARRYGVHAE